MNKVFLFSFNGKIVNMIFFYLESASPETWTWCCCAAEAGRGLDGIPVQRRVAVVTHVRGWGRACLAAPRQRRQGAPARHLNGRLLPCLQ